MTATTDDATGFGWLLDTFVHSVPGARHTLVVSADGLLMAMSRELDRTSGDQLSAIVAGLSSLTAGAARQLGGGQVRQCVVETDTTLLVLMSISDGSVLAVVADATCDIGLVAYEMAMLATRAEATLTPQLVTQMRANLPVDGARRSVVTR
jgi:hypothetical protein